MKNKINLIFASLFSLAMLLGFGRAALAYQLPATGSLGHFQDANGTIGKEDFTVTANTSPDTNNSQMQEFNQPTAMTIDKNHNRLWVADSQRNRVLEFDLNDDYTLKDGNADFVLGQSDFTGYSANRGGSIASAGSGGMNSPKGVAYDSNDDLLYVADAGNNRILVFSTPGNIGYNGFAPIKIIGQSAGNTNVAGTAANRLSNPTTLAYDDVNNRLFVSDANNSRVLVFDVAGDFADKDAANATIVLGQPDMTTSGPALGQTRMNSPQGLAFDSDNDRLFVADRNNNRVLVFAGTLTSGMNATNVLGQTSWITNGAAKTKSGLSMPTGLAYDSNNHRLFVAESYNGATPDNNRVMLFDVSSITNGQNATSLIGQTSFTASDANSSTTSNISIGATAGLMYEDDLRQLYVADYYRNRIMIFQMPYIATQTLDHAKVGSSYLFPISAVGGSSPYTYTVTSGLSGLASAGLGFTTSLFFGNPTKAGSYDVTVQVQDNSKTVDHDGFIDTENYTLVVDPANYQPDTTAPTIPLNLNGKAASDTQINLSWAPSTDPDSIVAGYNVYRDGTLLTTTLNAYYTDTGLTAQTSYQYIISAVDPTGNTSANTNSIGVTTLAVGQVADLTAPSAPKIAGSAASTSQIDLSWNGATDNVGVTGYDVYRNGSVIASVAGTNYADLGLQQGTGYTYYVVAKDANGNFSSPSASILVTTSGPLANSSSSNNSSSSKKSSKKKDQPAKRVLKNAANQIVARGSIMVQSGKRFSKNSAVLLYYTNRYGNYAKPLVVKTDKSGNFSTSFKVTKPAGTYSWYVQDVKSGAKTKVKKYNVI